MGRSASLAWGAWSSLSQAAASWCSRFCGSADFPRKTTPGAACGWPTVSGWTPAARACGTRLLNTSTSAPNTSRKTALSWWESGGSYCQPTLEWVVRHQSSGLSGAALCPGEVHEQLARMLRQTDLLPRVLCLPNSVQKSMAPGSQCQWHQRKSLSQLGK